MTSLPTAIYARFSTDRQDARSIEDQERRCRRYADEHGCRVVQVYADAAVSGAHLERAEMQRMLTEAKNGKRCAFRAVLVDDLSRLSRDAGNMWQVVFRDLAAAGIKVIDCNTGMASDGAGARLAFGAMALVNDQFLQLVRAETHRGLEGRALAGFHTGGRCFGYTTRPEENPPDPAHVRAVSIIAPAEAKAVRRIFETFAAGHSTKSIAEKLNAEGVPAPYDSAYPKPAGRGWGSGTVRAMLRNERYLGRVVWNQREWFRHPTSGKRRSRIRPESEWVRVEAPDLRIIDDELWAKVQARIGQRRQLGAPRAKVPSPLSGLLRCGSCNSRLTLDIGTGGYRNFQCAANKTKGAAICPNAKRVSEQKVLSAFVATVKEGLAHPQFRAQFDATFKRLWAEAARPAAGESETERQLRAQEARVGRLAAVVAENADIEALLRQLRTEEAKLRDLRERAAAEAKPRQAAPPPYPTAGQLAALWDDVEGTLTASPHEAKEVLTNRFEPVVLTPTKEGWSMETAMRLGPALEVPIRFDPAVPANDRVEMWPKYGCGGPISEPSATANPSFRRRSGAA